MTPRFLSPRRRVSGVAFGALAAVSTLLLAASLSAEEETPAASPNLAAAWTALGSETGDDAEAALAALAASPDEALDLIESRLAPLPSDVSPRVRELVAQFRDARYASRELAQQQLAVFGPLARPELERLQAAGLPLEAKSRVERVLDRIPGAFASSEHERRLVRTLNLLQRIDQPRAQELLKALAPLREWTIVDPRLPALYADLMSTSPAAQARAAVSIIQLGEAGLPALPRLIELMGIDGPPIPRGNTSRRVADHIAGALPTMGVAIVQPLIDALHDAKPGLRQRATKVLGTIRDERAIEPLIDALVDSDAAVSSAAAAALVRFRAPAVGPLLEKMKVGDNAMRGKAAQTVSRIGDEATIPPIAALMHDADAGLRRIGATSLVRFKMKSLDPLLAALNDDDPNIAGDPELRAQILQYIANVDDARSTAAVVQALRDKQPQVRKCALASVLQRSRDSLNDAPTIDVMFSLLNDDDAQVRFTAAQLIGNANGQNAGFDSARVASALIPLLEDRAADVRVQAAGALGQWHAAAAVDPLIRLLEDDDVGPSTTISARLAAAEALGKIGDARAVGPLRRYLDGRADQRIIGALGDLRDRDSVPTFIELLASRDEVQQRTAAYALGKVRDRRAVEPLIAALAGPETVMRAAAEALGEIRDPRAVEPLIARGRVPAGPQFNPNPFDNRMSSEISPVARPLVRLGPAAIEPLARALSDSSEQCRQIAAWALYNIQTQGDDVDDEDMKPALAPLVAALGDSDAAVRYNVALALGAHGDARAAPVLLDIVRTNSASREFPGNVVDAPTYLGQLKVPSTFQPLMELLTDGRPATRANAARALGHFGDRRAVGPLVIRLEPLVARLDGNNAEATIEIIRALGRLKAVAAVDRLLDALHNDNAQARAAAAEALGHIGEARAADPLAALDKDDNQEARAAAAIALMRLNDSRGVDAIARALASDDAKLREQAAIQVSNASLDDERLTGPLINALDDSVPQVRIDAALALGKIASKPAVDALIAHQDDRENVLSILQGLAATKSERAYKVLVEHLGDDNETVRAACAAGLGATHDAQYIQRLTPRLTDASPNVRLAAVNALLALEAKSAVPQLTALAGDDDPQVALYATRAVKRLTPTSAQ